MTVKELHHLLEVETQGDLEVMVRCRWLGESPAHDQFIVEFVSHELEPDTGQDVVMLECRQED